MYFIVGATGSLGGQVARALLERGERVRTLVRAESPLRTMGRFTDPAELTSLGAEMVEGDLRDPATLEPHLRGVKAVLSTASGTKRGPPDTVEDVDHLGTSALASAARRAGVEHFVYLSARGAGPEAPLFMRIKWAAENAVREHGPAATIVRPALFMQDWIGFVIGAQLHGGTSVQLVGEQDPSRTYVHEGDVAKLLAAILLAGPPDADESPRLVDFSADSATTGNIVTRMAERSGLPLTIERIPIGEPITTAPAPLEPTITHLLTMVAGQADDRYVTPDVERGLGFEPRGIDDYLGEMFPPAVG